MPVSQSANAPLHIGRVSLAVADLERLAGFYRSVIGLRDVGRSDRGILLGAGGVACLELRPTGNARPAGTGGAGLFHTAFLLPSRGDLGRWLQHAAANDVMLEGASDHGVSEAVYLNDPEGNGIEIYVDRPRGEWPYEGAELRMTTQRLAIPSVLDAARGSTWTGAPEDTHIGHIHLRVGDLARATDFYRDIVGLDLMVKLPSASFLSSGGYHHHVAANVWHSRGAPPRARDALGLSSFELSTDDGARLDAIASRARTAGLRHDRAGDVLQITDPDGIDLAIAYRR